MIPLTGRGGVMESGRHLADVRDGSQADAGGV
jgi:hypothetical protein